jgi:hypothetical protein
MERSQTTLTKGVKMRNRTLTPTLLMLALLVTSTVLPRSARAHGGSCPLGFNLASGGVPEADLNSDGLTCELNMLDSATGLLRTFALDNGGHCPDGFICLLSVPPSAADRNGDGFTCSKLNNGGHFVEIDNNSNSQGPKATNCGPTTVAIP